MSEAYEKPRRLDTGDELDALLEERDVVLVEFYTKGCTLCQSIEPVVGNVARATDVTVAMLNPQTDLDLVDEYAIQSVPTLVLFEDSEGRSPSGSRPKAGDGEEVGRMANGFEGTESVVEFVTENSSAERR